MAPMGKKLFLAAAAVVLLSLPCAYLLQAERQTPDGEPLRALTAYIRAAYAHDLRKAYRYIAAEDRRLKSEAVYLREKGPFNGFTLDVARKLAELIEARLLHTSNKESRMRVNLSVRLPAAIDDLIRAGKFQMLEGEEEFVVVKEGNSWRVLFDWAAGLRIAFGAKVPAAETIEAAPVAKEANVKPNELFTVTYRVKNRSDQPIRTRIIHRVEPEELKQHLEIVQCGLLLPVKLPPQKELEFTSTYMVRGDLPEGAKNLNITYEFQAAE